MDIELVRNDCRKTFLELLCKELLSYLKSDERMATAIEGLMLTRIDHQTAPEQCLYYPLIALVVQGRKQAFYGEREISYGAGEYVVLGNDMPGIYHILDSSPENPFLSISIRLDPKIITNLILNDLSNSPIVQNSDYPAIAKETASCDLLLAFYRLLRLLDSPETIPLFAPSLIREIHYTVLNGKHGEKIRLAVTPGTRDNRIAQAIAWMRGHFKESFSMPELARNAGMAPATFNRYFRELTSISPLQFQKRLRLYEAQRLMFLENMDARSASSLVGYESEAQFSREYKRLFGQPPAQDAAKSHA